MKRDEFVKQIQNLRNKRIVKAKPAKIVQKTAAGAVKIPKEDSQIVSISKTINTVHKINSGPTTGCSSCGRKKR